MMRLASLPVLSLALALLGCGDDTSADDSDGSGGSSAQNGAGPSTGSGAGEPPEQQGMTAAHNAVRAAASASIPPLTWDPTVASVAQAYATKFVFEHSSSAYGDNLLSISYIASELADYDYASNSCCGVCGHYTQIVWADSLRLGCGVANCTTGSPFGSGSWQIWVCNYDPPGNYVGQKPY